MLESNLEFSESEWITLDMSFEVFKSRPKIHLSMIHSVQSRGKVDQK